MRKNILEDDEELKEIITGLCGDKKENYPLDELAASICNYYNSVSLHTPINVFSISVPPHDFLHSHKKSVFLLYNT